MQRLEVNGALGVKRLKAARYLETTEAACARPYSSNLDGFFP